MLSIALDGPVGAGKTTIARELAKRLGFLYVDTGALYRSIGKYVLDQGGDPSRPADTVPALGKITLQLRYNDARQQRVYLNGEDVSDQIRTPAVSMAASQVGSISEVREFLLSLQRDIARQNNVVMDGRDIGTTILPDASLKIFLTASAEARAARRHRELSEKGDPSTFEQVLEDLKKRDYDDSHRAASPLAQAPDAVLVDTTSLSLEESIDELETLARNRLFQRDGR
ncbi:MAG: (d)CMP kinase [Oscillospiraceae bacterium]|jgi:cytidylate kinase|nr:(d)CMP kinase [Oscillospiraceae bacterium]